MVKKTIKKAADNVKKSSEVGARHVLLEELFYDMNISRVSVYKMNFFRGIFFGVGTALGGSIVVAVIIWMLSLLTDIPGGIGEFIQFIVDSVKSAQG